MKFILMATMTIFSLDALASCLVNIEKANDLYIVTLWKHSEDGSSDTTDPHAIPARHFDSIKAILDQHKRTILIFNKGVFTALKYDDDEKGKNWAMLSNAEKDMIYFLQSKFNVNEK